MSWIDEAYDRESELETAARERLLNQIQPWWEQLCRTLTEDVAIYATKRNFSVELGVTKRTEASVEFGIMKSREPFISITLDPSDMRVKLAYYKYLASNSTNINHQEIDLEGRSFTEQEIPELSRQILMPCLFPLLHRRDRAKEMHLLAEGLRSKLRAAGPQA